MTGIDTSRADAVYAALLERQGEQWVQPRLERTRRVLELLGDPQHNYRVVHVTGTNGKTSTSRLVESLLRAYGLRTGMFTSPHLTRFTERIAIDGEPIADAAVAEAWEEMQPFVELVDAQLVSEGEARLTFFEVLTALAFVAFSDAPVDVAVVEVGMGGAWDSTNTADGDVAVIGPVGIDHADRLGDTVTEIARVKAGIIKPDAAVVSAAQLPEVEAVLRERAADVGASVAFEGKDFALVAARLGVGGQQIDVRGLAGEYSEEFLPLYGIHQAQNAALAVAAVESLVGGATQHIAGDVLAEGLARVISPGRLQLVGAHPTVLVDAAHNPHGTAALVQALGASFDVDEWGVIVGVLADKDTDGIIARLAPLAAHVFATAPDSDRADDADAIADAAEAVGLRVSVHRDLAEAADAARSWAAESDRRAVVIAGSVVLAGEALALSEAQAWKDGWTS